MASLSADSRGLLRAHHDRRSAASAEISDDHPSINCLRWRSGNSARVCCDVALALAAPNLHASPRTRRSRASSNPHFANGPTIAPTRTRINDLLLIDWLHLYNWHRPRIAESQHAYQSPLSIRGQPVKGLRRPWKPRRAVRTWQALRAF